jgi:hypothetical protein
MTTAAATADMADAAAPTEAALGVMEYAVDTKPVPDIPAEAEIKDAGAPAGSITAEDILARIDMIISDTEYLHNAVRQLTIDFPVNESPEGGRGDAARAAAVQAIVAAREETNRRMIDMLNGMMNPVVRTPPAPVHSTPEDNKRIIVEAIAEKISDVDTDLPNATQVLGNLNEMMNKLI